MAHMLIATDGARGDILPFIVLGQALRDLGHEVTLFAHCIYEAEALGAGLKFVAWETKEEWEKQSSNIIWGPMREIEQYIQSLEDKFSAENCKKEIAKLKPYCLIEDTVMIIRYNSTISALLAAEIYKIPIVSFFLTPSYLTQISIDQDLSEESNTRLLNMVRNSLGLPPVKSYTAWTCVMKYKICLWPGWFYHHQLIAREHAERKYFITVGFFDYSVYKPAGRGLSKEVEDFLAQGDAPVIISGSSGRDDTLKYFDVAIPACIQLGLRVLAVTPFYDLVAGHLNNCKNNTLKWVDFIDFEALLPHTRAIIHHGGIGTITYALCFKVPQLILAGNIDRPFNASLIKNLGLGEFLPVALWKVNTIKAATLKVLNDPTIRSNCNHYADLMLKENTISKTTKIIENAIGNPKFLIDIDKILSTDSACERVPYNFNQKTKGEHAEPKREEPTADKHNAHAKLQNIADKRKEILTRLLHEKLGVKNL